MLKIKSGDIVFWKSRGIYVMDKDGNPRRFGVFNVHRKYATIESEELYIKGYSFQKINILISELELAV
jgi:hypothetical protein